MKSYVPYSSESHFPLENLPYGVFSTAENPTRRIGVAIGDKVLDLKYTKNVFDRPLCELFQEPSLHGLMASGRGTWTAARQAIQSYLSAENAGNAETGTFWDRNKVQMHLPVAIGDYTDFFSSYHHAYNCGSLMSPAKPVADNWKNMPVAYHGRASSIAVSGTPVRRPKGQYLKDGRVIFGPTERLDYELEMAFFVGGPLNGADSGPPFEPIPTGRAAEHVFGMVLLNDWSARDVQMWESHFLGPFLSKNFATSISPWVVTMDALNAFRTDNVRQTDPVPLEYLAHDDKYNFDIRLNATVRWSAASGDKKLSRSVCDTNYKYLYWTPLQQVAHHTVTGCNLKPGDLLSSGTISGPEDGEQACLFERTYGGRTPLDLGDRKLMFLDDGDEVVLSGYCQGDGYRVGFGECVGNILPAAS